MNEYDYEDVPRSPGPARTDHGRVVTSGAWTGAIIATLAMCWVSAKVPYVLAWLVNSSVTIGVSYAMARWKRAWYAWLAFWLIVAVSLANGILKAATSLLDSPWSGASWALALIIVWSWYWLVRIPRLRPVVQAIERHEVHVIHHVIHHGRELPGWVSAEVTGGTAAPISAPARKVIAGTAQRAIGPARKGRLARFRETVAGTRIKELP